MRSVHFNTKKMHKFQMQTLWDFGHMAKRHKNIDK